MFSSRMFLCYFLSSDESRTLPSPAFVVLLPPHLSYLWHAFLVYCSIAACICLVLISSHLSLHGVLPCLLWKGCFLIIILAFLRYLINRLQLVHASLGHITYRQKIGSEILLLFDKNIISSVDLYSLLSVCWSPHPCHLSLDMPLKR